MKKCVKIEQKIAKINEDYQLLIDTANGTPIPTTPANLRIVMLYLNQINWGVWQLPAMSIGYTANQHDCDGKTATTVRLDCPMTEFADEEEKAAFGGETSFVVGAPRGYLKKYMRLGRL